MPIKHKQNAHQSISVLVGPPHHLLNLLQGVVNCQLLVKQNSFLFLLNSSVFENVQKICCEDLLVVSHTHIYSRPDYQLLLKLLKVCSHIYSRALLPQGRISSQHSNLILLNGFVFENVQRKYISRKVVFNGCQSNLWLPTVFLECAKQTGGYL